MGLEMNARSEGAELRSKLPLWDLLACCWHSSFSTVAKVKKEKFFTNTASSAAPQTLTKPGHGCTDS
jgi:hypothetical protein